MVNRCWWCGNDPVYVAYHDQVWGRPERDDRKLFELLSLECFQSGLSWITILRKQAGFARAFAGWDLAAIAAFGPGDIERLMGDAAIVRNRKKIEAAINNAGLIPAVRRECGSFAAYVWRFEPRDRQVPAGGFTRETLPLMVDEAKQMSRDMKKRGFKFTGPMVCMSFMQAAGIINDHVRDCDLCPY